MTEKNLSNLAVTRGDIEAAYTRIHSVLPITPLTESHALSEILGVKVSFKWDLKFRTGSFKERGAVNVLLSLSPEIKTRGVCAASAGNHALALSFHAARLGVPCSIVMPKSAPLVKVRNTERSGARVLLEGTTFDEAYERARVLAADEGLLFVSAFDNPQIIAGQGTAGIEILEQAPDVDAILIPVGGGGLASGIGIAVKSARPDIAIYGVQSEWIVNARTQQPLPETVIRPVTIADGIAVKRIGEVTGPLLRAVVDKLVTVSEAQIAHAILRFLEHERTLVEGAGASALAALLAGTIPAGKKHLVVMACGGNIDINVLSRLIERDMAHTGRLLKVIVSVPDRPGSLYRVTGAVSAQSANVIEVLHDRSFSRVPGNVDITLSVEVRDEGHKNRVLEQLRALGIEVRDITQQI